MAHNTESPRWCKSKCEGTACDGGSLGTYQKRVYALAVAVAMNGAPICHCGAPVSLWRGEVDRTEPGCYRPRYCVMTCHDCNNDRTHVEEFDTEAFHAAVFAASADVAIVSPTFARRTWQAGRVVGESLKTSRFMRK